MDVRRTLSRHALLAILVGACTTAEAIDYGEDALALDDTSDTTSTDGTNGRPPRRPPPCSLDAAAGRLVPRAMNENERPPGPPPGAEANGERPRFDPLSCQPPPAPPEGATTDGQRPPPPDGGSAHRGPPPGPPPHAVMGFLYDADDSGDLSDAEKAEMQADLVAHCDAMTDRLLANVDLDSSGTLSEDELLAARDAHEAERAANAPPEGERDPQARCEARRDDLLEQFDANTDGTLDTTELAALRNDAREQFRNAIPPER